jgi:EAL domain-containing protein (putative c-di-GMP-specific phosphodiesterase class I)
MISVNISILQLIQSDFCDIVLDTLQQLELDTDLLELEITESVLMESIESIENELRRLSERNIKIALDDFGKGYSSLNYLRQLPITTLKVDKSFIDCIINEEENTLTGQIVTLGKSMDMCVVAEGVEKQQQLDYLRQYDCDKIQGFIFSKPLPEAELIRYLESSDDLAAATLECE